MERTRTLWIIHGDPVEGTELSKHYSGIGYLTTHIYTEKEAIAKAQGEHPDVIVISSNLPDVDTLTLMKRLGKAFGKEVVPFIFLGPPDAPKVVARALDSGAFDYVRSPYSSIELDARIKSAIAKRDVYKALQEKNEQLERMAVTDSLTGLYNHRFLIEQLDRHFNLFQRFNRPFTFIMLDIDHFKKINDQYGHITGDQVLIEFSNVLKSGRRNMDIIGRYGGEEFGLILPEIGSDNAGKVALRILKDIQSLTLNPKNNPSVNFGISASMGVVSCPDTKITTSEEIIHLADQSLYKAKDRGGNTVIQIREGLFTEIKNTL